MKNLSASRKILFAFGCVASLAAIVGLVIVWSLIAMGRSGEQVGARLAPLVDAAMEIKLHGANAHLVMEEIMAGDTAEDFAEVGQSLEEARFYAQAILNGGENDEGRFYPTESSEVRVDIEGVLEGIDAFATASESRYALLHDATGVGSEADERFDALYDEIEARIDAATVDHPESDLQRLAGDARYLLAHGHLLVAEILGGDFGEDFGEATGSFEAAHARLTEVIARYPMAGETLAPILPDIKELNRLAVERYDRELERTRLTQEAEIAFDNGYDAFVSRADVAETDIQAAMAEGLAEQAAIKARAVNLAIGALLLVATLLVVFYRWLDNVLGHRMEVIARAMEELTDGRLEISVPDWGTTDEIGLLRGKLEDLRQALVRQRELENNVAREREAAEKGRRAAEQARQSAEEAQATAEMHKDAAVARSNAASAFSAAFAEVVKAARDGDLSRRIEIRTGQEDLDGLGEALNDMLGSIERSVVAAMEVTAAVARGDLCKQMEGEHRGVFGKLKESFDTTTHELGDRACVLSGVSRKLTAEVGVLSESSSELSKRSMSQAAALAQTNGAMKELSKALESTEAELSASVAQVKSASTKAQSGQLVVENAINAVGMIAENSRKVGEFITVIDEISFQTNLLALNAGVEAARAGESGKGFAVVAQEVRALAQRANEAASGIGELIEESGRSVATGVQMVKDTGDVLSEILQEVTSVAQVSERTAETSRQQNQDIAAVVADIKRLDDLTQQNGHMAKEGTRLAESLRDRTNEMEESLAFFRVAPVPHTSDLSTEVPVGQDAMVPEIRQAG